MCFYLLLSVFTRSRLILVVSRLFGLLIFLRWFLVPDVAPRWSALKILLLQVGFDWVLWAIRILFDPQCLTIFDVCLQTLHMAEAVPFPLSTVYAEIWRGVR